MEELNLFSAKIWSTKLNLDKEILLENLYNHANNTPCVRRSNIGGYQGHNFDYEPLNQAIIDNVPEVEDTELGDLWVKNWININVTGNSNARHTHSNGLTLLSGVYYVSVPENSGGIVFHDPRGPILQSMANMRYYGESPFYTITPVEDTILYFPSWLEHEVEGSNNDEDRISISFNISREEDVAMERRVNSSTENHAFRMTPNR